MNQHLSIIMTTTKRTFLDQKLLARRRPFGSFSGRGRWGTGIAGACFAFLFLAARLLPEMERTSDLSGPRNSLRDLGAAIEVSTVEVMTIIIIREGGKKVAASGGDQTSWVLPPCLKWWTVVVVVVVVVEWEVGLKKRSDHHSVFRPPAHSLTPPSCLPALPQCMNPYGYPIQHKSHLTFEGTRRSRRRTRAPALLGFRATLGELEKMLRCGVHWREFNSLG